MGERTRILVCGDAGPARQALLSRQDIQVLWTDTQASALAIVRSVRPELCLVRPRLEEGTGAGLISALRAQSGPPAVAVLLPGEWGYRTECLAAGAVEVVEMERSQAVLEVIGRYTGLAFAKDPRVPYHAVIQVTVDREEHRIESINLSVSGMAVKHLPPQETGTLVGIRFMDHKHAPMLWAHVMRCWNEQGDPMAGLRFVGVSQNERAWLAGEVERRGKTAPRPKLDLTQLLFADLHPEDEASHPLTTADLELPGKSVTVSMRLDPRLPLERYLEDSTAKVPPWVPEVARTLTAIERAVALHQGGPNWAERSLDLRVRLAEGRALNREGAVETELSEEASQLFAALRHHAQGQPDDVVAQIAEVRAVLLKELTFSMSARVDSEPAAPEGRQPAPRRRSAPRA